MQQRNSNDEGEATAMAGREGNTGKARSTSTNDDPDDESFDFEIDPEWLLDASLLRLGMEIGEGASSTVLKGLYNSDPVAVKVIESRNTSTVTRVQKEKFQREVLALSRMDHENVIKLIGVTIEPMRIVTELVEGGTLHKYLRSVHPNCLDLKLAISFALDVSRAMEYLHDKDIIHRDLKPDNLLLTEDKMHVKLADFGLAREVDTEGMTCEAGTYRWMAPELFTIDQTPGTGKKQYNVKADVFSFSMVLWELLTNKIPFEGMSPIVAAFAVVSNKRPSLENLSRDVVLLLEDCWKPDPEGRPEFKQITASLENLLENLDSTQTTPPPRVQIADSENIDAAGNDSDKSDHDDKGKKQKTSLSCFSCFHS